MILAVKIIVGIIIALPGVLVILAREKAEVKEFIEDYILRKKVDLFTGEYKGSWLIKYLGWECVTLGILIAAPIPDWFFYGGIVVGIIFGISLCYKYNKHKEADPNAKPASKEKTVSGEVVGNTTSANDSDGQGLTSDTETTIKNGTVSAGVVGNISTPTCDDQKS